MLEHKKPKAWTAISIEPKTKDRLLSAGSMNDTYDTLIRKLLVLRDRHIQEFEGIVINK
jgi:hypothetical protein